MERDSDGVLLIVTGPHGLGVSQQEVTSLWREGVMVAREIGALTG